MTKWNRACGILLVVLIFALLTACQGTNETVEPTAEPVLPTTWVEPVPEGTDEIEETLRQMSIEEKVGQLLVAGIQGTTPGEDAERAIQEFQVGGIILFKRNVESVAQLTALTDGLKELNQDSEIPLLIGTDEEGGMVSRMPDELLDLPDMYTFGETGEGTLTYTVGRVLADLCRNQGINLDFAPVLDVWSNPNNTVIGRRAFGTDADTVIAMGLPVMEGLRDYGVIPVVKHFPGHGDTLTDSHEALPVVDKTVEELWELELKPFAAAIEDGADVVMVGHILERGIDPDAPASLSYAVVTELLREEMGFSGVVCTDDLTMGAITAQWGIGEAAVQAVEAGDDLLLVCHGEENLMEVRQSLLTAVDEGRITEERLDESVRRILTLKEKYALSDEPAPGLNVSDANEVLAALLS